MVGWRSLSQRIAEQSKRSMSKFQTKPRPPSAVMIMLPDFGSCASRSFSYTVFGSQARQSSGGLTLPKAFSCARDRSLNYSPLLGFIINLSSSHLRSHPRSNDSVDRTCPPCARGGKLETPRETFKLKSFFPRNIRSFQSPSGGSEVQLGSSLKRSPTTSVWEIKINKQILYVTKRIALVSHPKSKWCTPSPSFLRSCRIWSNV